MKKFATYLMVGALMVGIAAPVALAETTASASTTAEFNVLIGNLTRQIADLQAKLAALKSTREGVATTNADVQATLKAIGELKQGMTSDQIAQIQALLAADKSVYPEGLVTGYYGPLTGRAIAKFREKYEKRHEKFNERMKARFERMREKMAKMEERHDKKMDEMEKKFEERKDKMDEKFAKKFCHIPPGLLRAPGFEKTHHDEWNRLWNEWRRCNDGGTGTTTPDTTAPVISSLAASNVTHNGAKATWSTNESATTKLYYGTVNPLATSSASVAEVSGMRTSHEVTLSGLSANTAYYFLAESKDAAGNKTLSSQGTFTTAATPDTTSPVISGINASGISSTTANVNWTTDENATSKVYYGTVTPVNLSTALIVSNSTLVTAHTLGLGSLTASTTYRYLVVSTDASGNAATSSEQSFVTL